MANSCVLLEALKQFMDPASGAATDPPENLVEKSQETMSKAKSMLLRMKERRQRHSSSVEVNPPTTPVVQISAPSTPKSNSISSICLLYLPPEVPALFTGKTIRLPFASLLTLLQGQETSTSVPQALTLIRNTLLRTKQIRLSLVPGNDSPIPVLLHNLKLYQSTQSRQFTLEFHLNCEGLNCKDFPEGEIFGLKLFLGDLT